jgi:hypothetical protein
MSKRSRAALRTGVNGMGVALMIARSPIPRAGRGRDRGRRRHAVPPSES